jgi:hypothetical protein
MALDSQIARAIAFWRLRQAEYFRFARAYPPESFLPEQADIGRLAVSSERPHGGTVRYWPVRLPPLGPGEIAPLAQIGAEGGPSMEAAVTLLRRARRTSYELEAADAVLHAPGAVPLPVRIQAAYLYAANGFPELALRVLEGKLAIPTWVGSSSSPSQADAALRASTDAAPRRPSLTADAVLREVAFRTKHRAHIAPPIADSVMAATRSRPAPAGLEPEARPEREVSDLEVRALAFLGLSHGPSPEDAVSTLRATRGAAQGVRALRLTLSARAHGPLPEAVREVCADLLVELGDHEQARAVLAEAPAPPPPPLPPPGIDVDAPVEEATAATRAAQAERVLAQDTERLGVWERHTRFQAVARAAKLTLETFQSLGGRAKRDRAQATGRALEAAGEAGRAAEVYALGGDHAEAGRLGVPDRSTPSAEGGDPPILTALDALDGRGLRLAAVAIAQQHLADHPDPEVATFARGVVARLARGPVVTLAIDGREQRVALGEVVTLGRTGATIAIASPLVSRLHLRLRRCDGVAVVEDAGSHNGTWIAGARLSAPLPVGEGLDLTIGREIPCSIRAEGSAFAIEVAGERTLASLGPLAVGGLRIGLTPHREEEVVTLQAEPGVSASIGGETIDTAIELARGDVVRVTGDVFLELRVIG